MGQLIKIAAVLALLCSSAFGQTSAIEAGPTQRARAGYGWSLDSDFLDDVGVYAGYDAPTVGFDCPLGSLYLQVSSTGVSEDYVDVWFHSGAASNEWDTLINSGEVSAESYTAITGNTGAAAPITAGETLRILGAYGLSVSVSNGAPDTATIGPAAGYQIVPRGTVTGTNEGPALRFDSADGWEETPNFTLESDGTFHGYADGQVDGSVTILGDTTLGNAAGDSITINAGTINMPNYDWVDSEISDTITVGAGGSVNDAALSANVAHLNVAETIASDWVNTANPWADNEVVDDLTIATTTTAEFSAPVLIGAGTDVPVSMYIKCAPSYYWTGTTLGWVSDPSLLDSISGMLFVEMDESGHAGNPRCAKWDFYSATGSVNVLVENTAAYGMNFQIEDGIAIRVPPSGAQPYIQFAQGPVLSPITALTNPNGYEISATTLDGSFDFGGVGDFSFSNTVSTVTPTFMYTQQDEAGVYSDALVGFGSDTISDDLLVFGSPSRLALAGNAGTLAIVESPEASGTFYFTLDSTGDGAEVLLQSSAPAGSYDGEYTSDDDVFAATRIAGAGRWRMWEDAMQWWLEDTDQDYEDLFMQADMSSAELAVGGSLASREWDFSVDDDTFFVDASEDEVDVVGDIVQTETENYNISPVAWNPVTTSCTLVYASGTNTSYVRHTTGLTASCGYPLVTLEPGTVIGDIYCEGQSEHASSATADVWIGLFRTSDVESDGSNVTAQVGGWAASNNCPIVSSGNSTWTSATLNHTIEAGYSYSLILVMDRGAATAAHCIGAGYTLTTENL